MSTSFHNTHSNTYDRMGSNATYNVAKLLPDFIPAISPITADSYVLDNACGTGLVTRVLKQHWPSVRVHGTDLAKGMVDIYLERAAEYGWNKEVDGEVLDSRSLSTIKDETFTHVITNFGFVPEKDNPSASQNAAREMWRVLKPGGVAILTTWFERNFDKALEAAALTVRPNEEPYTWGNMPEYWNKGWWVMQELERAGFEHRVTIKSVPSRIEAATLDDLVDNAMLFKDMFYAGYSDDELKQTRSALKSEFQKLKQYSESETDAGIGMIAWAAVAIKAPA